MYVHEQIAGTPVVRRQIIDSLSRGKFAMQELFHMAHYYKSAQLYVEEAKRLERPIDVMSIGAGDMWDLHIFLHGMYVKKSKVMRSYTAFDIVDLVSPFGPKVSSQIQFEAHVVDLMTLDCLPVDNDTVDVAILCEIIEHVDFKTAEMILLDTYDILRPDGIIYITTPNADNTTITDKYHIDEWPLDRLIRFLEEIGYKLDSCHGTYIDRRKFNKANRELKRIPQEFVDVVEERFASYFQRLFLATPYPEYANGVAILARK